MAGDAVLRRCCLEGLRPDAERRDRVDAVTELFDRLPDGRVVRRECPAALRGSLHGESDAVEGPERVDDVDQVVDESIARPVAVICGTARQPADHRPLEGVAVCRRTGAQVLRHLHGQLRCQPREPRALDLRLPGGPLDPRQPDRQVLAEPVDRMVGAGRGDAGDRQVGPVRELVAEEPSYEVGVRGHLIGMHPPLAHRPNPPAPGEHGNQISAPEFATRGHKSLRLPRAERGAHVKPRLHSACRRN